MDGNTARRASGGSSRRVSAGIRISCRSFHVASACRWSRFMAVPKDASAEGSTRGRVWVSRMTYAGFYRSLQRLP